MSAADFARARGEMLDTATADERLSAFAVRVYTRLMHVYMNRRTRETWVAAERVAREVHGSLRHVRRAYRQLVKYGYLVADRPSRGGRSKGGNGLTTRYRMGEAKTVTGTTLLNVVSTVTVSAINGDAAGARTMTPAAHKPLERTLRENPPSGRENPDRSVGGRAPARSQQPPPPLSDHNEYLLAMNYLERQGKPSAAVALRKDYIDQKPEALEEARRLATLARKGHKE